MNKKMFTIEGYSYAQIQYSLNTDKVKRIKHRIHPSSFITQTFLSLALILLCCSVLSAQTTWTGTTNSDWATATNWDTGNIPTVSDDVLIPAASGTQPTISGTTTAIAKSVDVQLNASLTIENNGNLNIDGSTVFGLKNSGTLTNAGTISMGLNSEVLDNGIANEATGNFINNGDIITEAVARAGTQVILSKGDFTNDGNIDIGEEHHPFAFPILVFEGSLFTNNGFINIENITPFATDKLRVQDTGSELINNGVIDMNTNGLFVSFGGKLTNSVCGEILKTRSRLSGTGPIIDNYGLMTMVAFQQNDGAWNNFGTIQSVRTQLISSGNPVNNDDLIILPVTLTNDCGELSGVFGIGANLGSTVTIYTDATATVSAGAYDAVTNTFTPNFALSNTTYNLYVKVEDDANVCNDYILAWDLTVVTAPCCNGTTWTGAEDNNWDNANNWNTYLVPTACNNVVIPASGTQPTIGSSTVAEAAEVTVAANATLDISAGGVLSLETDGIDNFGSITNSGSIEVGLTASSPVPNAISNYSTGSFTNDGTITTGLVADAGSINIQTFGTFVNEGSIVLGPGNGYFGIGVYGNGLFTNNNSIDITSSSASSILVSGSPSSPEFLNQGVINFSEGGIRSNFGGTFTNAPCGELLDVGFNNEANSFIINEGLVTSPFNFANGGTWNNSGTIYSTKVGNFSNPNPITNNDLIIQPVTLTCSNLSPAFGIGANLGSTVTIYTDDAATMSAGTYDSGTNTFTPNFPLSNTTYNLYVKVEDDAGVCDDYILPWDLTVVTAPEICDGIDNNCDGQIDEGFTDTDGDLIADCVDTDDDNDGTSDVDEITCGSDPTNALSTCSPNITGCAGRRNTQGDISYSNIDTDGDEIWDSCDNLICSGDQFSLSAAIENPVLTTWELTVDQSNSNLSMPASTNGTIVQTYIGQQYQGYNGGIINNSTTTQCFTVNVSATNANCPTGTGCTTTIQLEVCVLPEAVLPPTANCWDDFQFDNSTCTYVNQGVQPTQPAMVNCWDDFQFDTGACEWVNQGQQPTQPAMVNCWDDFQFDTGACAWVNVGIQPVMPTSTDCSAYFQFDTNLCEWVEMICETPNITGCAGRRNTQGDISFSNIDADGDGIWDSCDNLICSGDQFSLSAAIENPVLTTWELTVDQSNTNLSMPASTNNTIVQTYIGQQYQGYNGGIFNNSTTTQCFTINVSASNAACPTGTGCTTTIQLEVCVLPEAVLPPTVNCWDDFQFDNSTCTYVNQGVQPTQPAMVNCWDDFQFDTGACEWVNVGMEPVITDFTITQSGPCAGDDGIVVNYTGTPGATVEITFFDGGGVFTGVINESGFGGFGFNGSVGDFEATIISLSLDGCEGDVSGIPVIPFTFIEPVITDFTITQSGPCAGDDGIVVNYTGTPGATVEITFFDGGGVFTGVINESGFGGFGFNGSVGDFEATIVSVSLDGCEGDVSGIPVIPFTFIEPEITSFSVTPAELCVGEQVTVTYTGTPGAFVSVSFFEGGGEFTGTIPESGFIGFGFAGSPGEFNATVNSITLNGCEGDVSDIPSVPFTVYDPEITSFSVTPAELCVGEQVTVTYTGTPGAFVSVSFFEGGGEFTGTIPESGFIGFGFAGSPGEFNATVNSITLNGCEGDVSDIPSVPFTVYDPEITSFESSGTTCQADGSGVSYSGTPGTAVNVDIPGVGNYDGVIPASGTIGFGFFPAPGDYTATITAISLNGCEGVAGQTVDFTSLPTPEITDFVSTETTCQADGSGVQYSGTPGTAVNVDIPGVGNYDGVIPASGIISFGFFPAPGDYTATITAISLNGCEGIAGQTVDFTSLPNPEITEFVASGTTCQADGSGVSYSGTPGTAVNVDIPGVGNYDGVIPASGTIGFGFFPAPGDYTATITAISLNGCEGIAGQTVDFTSLPNPEITEFVASGTTCQADGSGVSYSGTPGTAVNVDIPGVGNYDGVIPASGTIGFGFFPAPGDYTATITAISLNGCEGIAGQTVDFTSLPNPEITEFVASGTTCQADGSGVSYSGTPGTAVNVDIPGVGNYDGVIPASGTIGFGFFPAPGDYTATITAISLNGCEGIAGQTVDFTSLPTPEITEFVASGTTCQADGSGVSYSGTPGTAVNVDIPGVGNYDGVIPASGTIGFGFFPAPGDYTATITAISLNGCEGIAGQTVDFTSLPTPEISIMDSDLEYFCQGLTQLTASVSNPILPLSYEWSGGLGNQESAVIFQNGDYTVTVTNGNGCQSTATTHVNVAADEVRSGYVILAQEKVEIKESVVQSGGVGVIEAGGKAKVKDESIVHTFVKADEVDVDGDSYVEQVILSPATVSLPNFRFNNQNSNNNITVDENQTVTLSGSVYGNIKVKKGGTLLFDSPEIFAKKIDTDKEAVVDFLQPCELMISGDVKIDKENEFNTSGESILLYVEKKMDVKEESHVQAGVFALKKISAKGKDAGRLSTMTGLFISNKYVKSDKWTHWNWATNCYIPEYDNQQNFVNTANDELQLDAALELDKVKLVWMNNTGFKNDYFIIEKSMDGHAFSAMKTVENGNTEAQAAIYEDNDETPAEGFNYYRIKLILNDGTTLYSNIKQVELTYNPHEIGLFPNPAQNEIFVNATEFAGMTAQIQISSPTGGVLQKMNLDAIPDAAIRLSVSELEEGLYFMNIEVKGFRAVTKRFVVARSGR